MAVTILKERGNLIATLQPGLTDTDWTQLQEDLLEKVGGYHSHGVVLDVSGLDVLDSFATRILHTIAQACRLRGAETVIVGIQPEIAFTMVQLGWAGRLAGIRTALDLEDGLALLERAAKHRKP